MMIFVQSPMERWVGPFPIISFWLVNGRRTSSTGWPIRTLQLTNNRLNTGGELDVLDCAEHQSVALALIGHQHPRLLIRSCPRHPTVGRTIR